MATSSSREDLGPTGNMIVLRHLHLGQYHGIVAPATRSHLVRRIETTAIAILGVALIHCFFGSPPLASADPASPDFLHDVMPLLKERCVACHGPAKQKGELNLSVPAAVTRGGKSGPAVVPGNLKESHLWKLVEADEMPQKQPLRADEKAILRRWIEAGAPGLPTKVPAKADGDEHWAFQHLLAPVKPAVRNAASLRTPIDPFIQARLEAAGLSLNPEADRRTLIRRVSFDITGLPPTLAEIDAYLNDKSDRAYEAMVDRYLASPRYGERWGKFWLDAAGYADSNGYFSADTDRPLAYRYRDYVIRSLNADKPFDRFIAEQLAGDELAGYGKSKEVTPETIELLEATHFLRNSPDGTDSSDGNPDEVRADKYAVLEGQLQIMGSALLGMTVQCARCHDHKFEPLSQREYYQLQAVLYPAFNVDKWARTKDRQIVAASASQMAAYESANKRIDEQIAAARAEFRKWSREQREQGQVIFEDGFEDPRKKLAEHWSNTAPGDANPAGKPAVTLDAANAPAAHAADGALRIIEGGGAGDRALSTRQAFDWTPDDEGNWIQATFELVKGADYVAFFIALRDFDDSRGLAGGNILIDGAKAGGANVHLDYPGGDSKVVGSVTKQPYTPGRSYGVRITNTGGGKYELAHVVDGVIEESAIKLAAADLPDGGFGFEYCCGRSFTVDNVRVEAGQTTPDAIAKRRELAAAVQKKRAEHDVAIKAIEAKRPQHPGLVAAVTDLSPKIPEVYLLERGLYKLRKEKVEPRALAAISEQANPAELIGRASEIENSTGVRLGFARWLTLPDSRASALLARVTVNRWWLHHFGTGIVSTPDNLGYSGTPPSHPELLEFLARELVRSKWSGKAMHRLILHSAVYRQSSEPRADGLRVDADNRLLWRFPLRRLDAESIRDAMLAISGELDATMHGPFVPTTRNGDGDVVVSEKTAGALRRSIYLQQRRTQVASILDVFDAPSIVANCTMRVPTTIPLQSLKLLNADFSRRRAQMFAKRLMGEAESDAARIERAFVLATGHAPSKDDLAASLDFIAKQPGEYPNDADAVENAWTDFANLVLSMNAFLYVE